MVIIPRRVKNTLSPEGVSRVNYDGKYTSNKSISSSHYIQVQCTTIKNWSVYINKDMKFHFTPVFDTGESKCIAN